MKSLGSIFLVMMVFITSGFIVREKDENLNMDYYILQKNECFANFLLNLKKINAIVFIPDDKVELANSYALIPVNVKRAKKASINFINAYQNLKMIKPKADPANECSEPVIFSFNEIGMKVFVRKSVSINLANDVAVTPVPLPLPKPELISNIDDFKGKELPAASQNRIGFMEDNELKFYVPVKIKL